MEYEILGPNLEEEREIEYRERTAAAADQFWKEVRERIAGTEISFDQAKLAIRIMCGTPGWEALKYVYPQYSNLSVMKRKGLADEIYLREDVQEFVKWAKIRSQELYALDIAAWDWTAKDSETSLRLLIACAEEQLTQLNGVVNSTLSGTIINSVRELNRMREVSNGTWQAEKAKAVIFLHEDDLED